MSTIIIAPPCYPCADEVSYGAWLRYFASQLPHFAHRYGLDAYDIGQVQQVARDFVSWLAHHRHREVQPPLPVPTSSARRLATVVAIPPSPRSIFLLDWIAILVQRIRSHAAYRVADGYALGLESSTPAHESPHLLRYLPKPHLHVRQHKDVEKVYLTLHWQTRRDTVIELEVCRDGQHWEALQPTHAKQYCDAHPQPAELTQWLYRARYRWRDMPAGRWQRPVRVTVGPTV